MQTPLQRALVVFGKQPRPGRVKTRLAKDLGEKEAAAIYAALLRHTLDQGAQVAATRYLDLPPGDALPWPEPRYQLRAQVGDDLGQRMQQAFDSCFRAGHREVVLVGSDCPGLDAGYLEVAFGALAAASEGRPGADCVIGPASDGGYVLVGLSRLLPGMFSGIPWSTDRVWPLTRERLSQMGVSVEVLPTLDDVDDLESWQRHRRQVGDLSS